MYIGYWTLNKYYYYYYTFSNHVYLSLDMILVYLKVGMNQWSVFSPLLFAVVMDVVPSEARSGIPSKLMYADDLVLTAPIMEPLGRRLAYINLVF